MFIELNNCNELKKNMIKWKQCLGNVQNNFN